MTGAPPITFVHHINFIEPSTDAFLATWTPFVTIDMQPVFRFRVKRLPTLKSYEPFTMICVSSVYTKKLPVST